MPGVGYGARQCVITGGCQPSRYKHRDIHKEQYLPELYGLLSRKSRIVPRNGRKGGFLGQARDSTVAGGSVGSVKVEAQRRADTLIAQLIMLTEAANCVPALPAAATAEVGCSASVQMRQWLSPPHKEHSPANSPPFYRERRRGRLSPSNTSNESSAFLLFITPPALLKDWYYGMLFNDLPPQSSCVILVSGVERNFRLGESALLRGAAGMDLERFSRDKLAAAAGQRFVAGGHEYILAGSQGNGAIGVVRKARERSTGETVAVKFLAPDRDIDESSFHDISTRFRNEGKKGAALSHKHLIKVSDYEDNDLGSCFPDGGGPCNPFIVMKYVQGTTLEHYIQGQKATKQQFNITRKTLYIAYAVAQALDYLHLRKIVHRDVKPANIFLTRTAEDQIPGLIMLGDFGVVKWNDFKSSITSGTLTITGQQGLGTQKYMPLEQVTNAKEVNVRSDMYSFGITLFELFSNQIFPSLLHIIPLLQQRQQRDSVIGKLYSLGLGYLPFEYSILFESIYEMLAPSPKSRPSSKQVLGRLRYLLERHHPEVRLD